MSEIIKMNFKIDNLNLIFGITGILLTALTMSLARLSIKTKRKEYYLLNFIYILSFLIVIFSRRWLILLIGWEMVSVSTSLMLLWKGRGLAGQYFIVQFLGSSILLYAILLAINAGYSEIMPIKEVWLQNLLILGLGMKSAIFGLHFWLPPVHSQAPVPVSAVLSGWVVKLGFITYLKIIPEGSNLLLILGFLMVFYGGIKALLAIDYKVLLAYSSISQLGYIAIGIGSGVSYAYLGSILHIIAHGLAKTALFLTNGCLIEEYGSRCIYDFKDAWQRQTVSCLSIIISFSSLMGIPLLAGYNSKHLIKHGIDSGQFFSILLFISSLLTALYALRFLYWGIFRDLLARRQRESGRARNKYQLRKFEYLSLFIIIVLLLTVGFYGELIVKIIKDIDFRYNFKTGFLEVIFYLLPAVFILKVFNCFEIKKQQTPSLDILFNRVNRYLDKLGRYLYNLIYKDFQYQLLWIPLFLIFLLYWELVFH
ncbi:NADH-ubiquinone oxidoreductase [Iocasia frigidifontis]|uniref:NADH-ubiquinone oxidoreductase n=1 Tax=Iocasia fonsfrigidae TaxID=2682810 RepID=A0A8A7KAQ9_9FIRM|nr:complex I subunit 5 family protein [Iocasia fonsfrigidae]QTL98913.1 NADH-ubiquinone oxidoreductase [Iocasia fonsfrigidae]